MAEPKKMLKWRQRQGKGKIMKPSTFSGIAAEAKSRGLSAESAKKEAGAAYWQAAEHKFKVKLKK